MACICTQVVYRALCNMNITLLLLDKERQEDGLLAHTMLSTSHSLDLWLVCTHVTSAFPNNLCLIDNHSHTHVQSYCNLHFSLDIVSEVHVQRHVWAQTASGATQGSHSHLSQCSHACPSKEPLLQKHHVHHNCWDNYWVGLGQSTSTKTCSYAFERHAKQEWLTHKAKQADCLIGAMCCNL